MTRRRVFVDSWAWIAIAVADDADHRRATLTMEELLAERAQLLTSNFVLAETLTRLRYGASLSTALVVADETTTMAAAGLLDVVQVEELFWHSALTWFRRFTDQRFSFVDCTSFAIMEREAVGEALTADRHFATAGFVPLG